MNKAEMEEHWRRYLSLVEQAQSAEKQRSFVRVIELARASWDHIDGMLRHQRNNPAFGVRNLDGIELVLRYAPLVFDEGMLNQAEEFLKSKRRVAKESPVDLVAAIESARERLWLAYAIWDQLEREERCSLSALETRHRDCRSDLRLTLLVWESLNIVRRWHSGDTDWIGFCSWALGTTAAKCPGCGVVARHARRAIHEETMCHSCRHRGRFVRVADESIPTH